MRRACLRWTDEGRENLARVSASIPDVSHEVKKMPPYLFDEVADEVAHSADLLGPDGGYIGGCEGNVALVVFVSSRSFL